jgi:hypothetical protein
VAIAVGFAWNSPSDKLRIYPDGAELNFGCDATLDSATSRDHPAKRSSIYL